MTLIFNDVKDDKSIYYCIPLRDKRLAISGKFKIIYIIDLFGQIHFKIPINNHCNYMLELSDGNLLIGGDNNFSIFSIQKNSFNLIDQIKVIDHGDAVWSIIELDKLEFCAIQYHNIAIYSKINKKYKLKIYHRDGNEFYLGMLKINNNEVVISSHYLNKKVDFFNTNNLTKITTLNNIHCVTQSNGIRFISNNYFIVAGYKLYIINSNTRTVNKIIRPPIVCNSIVVLGKMIIFSNYKTLIIYKIISENEIQFIQ